MHLSGSVVVVVWQIAVWKRFKHWFCRFLNFTEREYIMNTKKIMIFILLQLSAWGLMASSSHADTQSDLIYTCSQGCHNVIVNPSGWSIDGSSNGRNCQEKTVAQWVTTLSDMSLAKAGLSAIGPTGATSIQTAAEFLYAMQYTSAVFPSVPLTSMNVVPYNNGYVNVGETIGFYGWGTFSDGTTRQLSNYEYIWVAGTSMTAARTGHGMDMINATLYVVGGADGSRHLATMEAYNLFTRTWESKASMSSPRHRLAVGVIDGKLYAVGGSDGSGTLATMEAYDPATNTWIPKASMSSPRQGLAVGVINGMLYAVGGSDGGSVLATMEVYDPATDTWAAKASMPTPRAGLAVGVIKGMLYAVGGTDGSGALATVEAYDPVTNTWVPKAAMSTPRDYLAVGTVNDVIYAIGGNGLATMEVYSLVTNSWIPKASMTTPRSGLAVSLLYGKFYVTGGGVNGSLATVEAYTPQDIIAWSSSNTSVATIDQTGLALGTGIGSTTITATTGNVSGSTTLTIGSMPDLVISAGSSSVASVQRGKTFTFNVTTQNRGTAATTASTSTGLYLVTPYPGEEILLGSVSVPSLAAGASQSGSITATVPKKLDRGTYYLTASADYANTEAESNESNNDFFTPIEVVK